LCLPLGFPQAQTYRRRRAAFWPVRDSPIWTEDRDQRLVSVATHRAISLNGARGISLVTLGPLFARCALGTLWSLRASLALCARDALDTLRSLRTGRSLGTRIALRAGFFSAAAKRQRHAYREYRQNPHENTHLVGDGQEMFEHARGQLVPFGGRTHALAHRWQHAIYLAP
jgi:hypothetical protein